MIRSFRHHGVFPAALALASALALAACERPQSDEPIVVSIIGEPPPARIDPNRGPLSLAEAGLLGATAQGLVRHDAAGQIEPGLAVRWAISDDGLYYTFRLADIDGLDAKIVARRLKDTIRQSSRNMLTPLLGAIKEIVAVTPDVLEIQLAAPRPALLDLLAQPEMTIAGPGERGSGPFAIARNTPPIVTLSLVDREFSDEQPTNEERRRRGIILRFDRAALAVARYKSGKSDLVTGGTVLDLAIAQLSQPRDSELRFDPANGLFGLKVVARDGFMASAENRRALSMALNRESLPQLFTAPSWAVSSHLVAMDTIELPRPAQPGWATLPLAARRAQAVAIIRSWQLANPGTQPHVRVALPSGPGATLLFAFLRASWAAIGVAADRVDFNSDADLRLTDQVAPSQSSTWYLRQFECERSIICSEAADIALEQARHVVDPAERAARIADADLRLLEIVPYIPIAVPLRWSLVSPRLSGFQTNKRAVHPLNHLIDTTR